MVNNFYLFITSSSEWSLIVKVLLIALITRATALTYSNVKIWWAAALGTARRLRLSLVYRLFGHSKRRRNLSPSFTNYKIQIHRVRLTAASAQEHLYLFINDAIFSLFSVLLLPPVVHFTRRHYQCVYVGLLRALHRPFCWDNVSRLGRRFFGIGASDFRALSNVSPACSGV